MGRWMLGWSEAAMGRWMLGWLARSEETMGVKVMMAGLLRMGDFS